MTRQQQWAKEAYARVLSKKGSTEEAKYKTLCMTTPALLQKSGLVQGLAFLWSRDQDKPDRPSVGKGFMDDLAEVYDRTLGQGKGNGKGYRDHAPGRKLMKTAQRQELAGYMAMTADLIDVAIWFRRFAQAELQGDHANEEV